MEPPLRKTVFAEKSLGTTSAEPRLGYADVVLQTLLNVLISTTAVLRQLIEQGGTRLVVRVVPVEHREEFLLRDNAFTEVLLYKCPSFVEGQVPHTLPLLFLHFNEKNTRHKPPI